MVTGNHNMPIVQLLDLTPAPELAILGSGIRGTGTELGPAGFGSKSDSCSVFLN